MQGFRLKPHGIFLIFVVALVMQTLNPVLHAASSGRFTGTYTNMYYNREGGDLLGEELKIVPVQGGTYEGALQFAEGEPGPLILVDIKRSGSTITFSVPESDLHAGQFSGTLSEGTLRGQFRFKKGATETVILKKGKSYWD